MFMLIMMFFACDDTPEGVTINGTIKNAANKMIYLSDIKMVDSTMIDANGNFSFAIQANEEKFINILLSDKNGFLLLIDSLEDINIVADANNLYATYEVSGSPGSSNIRELNHRFDKTKQAIDKLGKIVSKNEDNPKRDSIIASLNKRYVKIMRKQRLETINFLKENNASLAALPALFQQVDEKTAPILEYPKDKKIFMTVYRSLSKKYPNSESVKILKNFIDGKERILKANKQKSATQENGSKAPEIVEKNPAGKSIALSSLQGKYVLLDFWAAWCKPCRFENPNLVTNYAKYKQKGFEIYQVSLDREKQKWIDAIEKDNLGDWIHVSDLAYWDSKHARLYNVRSIPANFLLDKEGKIIAKNLRGDALSKKLAEIFN